MRRESFSKQLGSQNTRSLNFRDPINSVLKDDTACVVCGGPLKPGATKYCGFACYRIVQRSGDLAARFWVKVDKGAPDACWLWTAAVFGSLGYGQFRIAGEKQSSYAHRMAWELTHGPIPDDKHCLHRCDRPACCNPAHLFLGTHRNNMEDAARKGRLSVQRPRKQIVSKDTLNLMRDMRATGSTLQVIADACGVTKTYVSLVVRGLRRQHPQPRSAA